MTLAEALQYACNILTTHQIEDARLEAELLMRHVINKSREELYLDLNNELDIQEQAILWKLVDRRLGHEPTAYITGHREFYGLDFYVDHRVLIPRPESELLVGKSLEWTTRRESEPSIICEVGTGSGAIAITLAYYLSHSLVYAIDISPETLDVAAKNCRRYGVEDRFKLLRGNLLEPLPEAADLIVANLPYLGRNEMDALAPEIASYEPRLALDGGETGLDALLALSDQIPGKLRPGSLLLLEIGAGQSEIILSQLNSLMPNAEIKVLSDLSGNERVVSLNLPV